ncbi:aspartate aminotransferase family protein [Opitutus terrae]|uniref:alanine--glyoxylate transaminase n=1 Tax=Opitutus terrae (strain DSM 11246 / JCM 15787 / PB90-1) TaxID=452637 RepID=B1ZTG7_OPITP|nr:aminotransferase class III-fold pyridoxal phosphate-dependent enzyme [Opitutus terrae]ACB73912.1 aminotransferase class-III [Opitutus terrae PB90-1]
MKSIPLPPTTLAPQPYTGPSAAEVLALRQRYLNPGLFLYYKRPLMLVEGKMQYVWDETGRRYLDGIGGILTVSVGHCHPHVVAAANRQNETIQHTTTIYLQPAVAHYAEKLASKLPGDLKVCYFVNSGSEANDLALLMARAYTGAYDVIALRNAYHGGNASGMSMTAQSTWKFNVPHSFGVHHAVAPYPYRGVYGYDDADAGRKYAEDVKSLIDHATPGRVAGFIAESIMGVGGFVVFPHGYLHHAYEHVRAAGGVCIADEVQTGFGRTGTHYWGFESQGVIPDIVTMAKGIGNGAPLAAVVTTPKIAAVLTQKVHFNTFGGNPVVSVIGQAVLEVIDRENLQANCLTLGRHLLEGLEKLKARHAIIGDVRGQGLMLGIEFVKDRVTKEPGRELCAQVVENARELGLLLGKGGLWSQTIRIAPPMCLTRADADFILAVLDEAIGAAGK